MVQQGRKSDGKGRRGIAPAVVLAWGKVREVVLKWRGWRN